MDMVSYLKNNRTVLSSLVSYFGGFAIGGAVFAWYEKKHLEAKYEATLRKEIEATKEFYRVLNKTDISPQDLIKTDDKPITKEYVDAQAATRLESEGGEEETDQSMEEAMEIITDYFPDAQLIKTVHEDEPEETTAEHLSRLGLAELVVMQFYREDGTLVSEEGLPVYHPENTIGVNNFRGLDGFPDHIQQVCYLDEGASRGFIVDLVDGAFEGQSLRHMRHRGSAATKRFRVNDDEWDA